MKISKIALPFMVETKSDAFMVINNEESRQLWLGGYGDQDAEYDERFKVWRVPAFSTEIKEYCEAKQRFVDKYDAA